MKTHVKAGGIPNHNETLARHATKTPRPRAKTPGLRVKTHVKAGGIANHNETLVRDAARTVKPKRRHRRALATTGKAL